MSVWTIPFSASAVRRPPVRRRRGSVGQPGRSRAGLFGWAYPGERSRRLDGLIGVLDVGMHLLLVLVGLVFVFHPEHLRASLETGAAPSVRQLALAVAIALVAFAGAESSIGDLPGEARDPARDLRPVTGARSRASWPCPSRTAAAPAPPRPSPRARRAGIATRRCSGS